MPTALTIAGSDSGGGAGIQADLKTFAAHGVYGTCAITAVTAQNTVGVNAVLTLPSEIVTAQVRAVADDIGVDAVKTGMLSTTNIVKTVAALLPTLGTPHIVVDPVMVAKSGDRLLSDDAIDAIKTALLPLASVVTPNTMEAEVLTGVSIASLDDAREAARRICALGASTVVIKGGHMAMAEAVDLLYDGSTFVEVSGPRFEATNTHGTGCTFGAAIAANLALGRPLSAAVSSAKTYVAQAIQHGIPLGHGHGPVDHFWQR